MVYKNDLMDQDKDDWMDHKKKNDPMEYEKTNDFMEFETSDCLMSPVDSTSKHLVSLLSFHDLSFSF